MAGDVTGRTTAYWPGIALPVLGAVFFSLVLRGLLPAGVGHSQILDPSLVAGVCFAGQLLYAGFRLDSSAGYPLGRLAGLANLLTLFRGALYAVVVGFVVVPPTTALTWVPAGAYGAGVFLDKLDGTVARTVGEVTELGRRLDMALDTFGFVAAPLLAVVWGQLPVWYLTLSAARYVYRGAIVWRQYRDRPIFEAPDSDLGKYLAGVQMVFLTAALAPVVPTRPVWLAAPFVLAPSLLVFLRDFLVVSGRLH